jgi:hypothetical protein
MKLIPPQNSGKQKKSEIGAHNPTAQATRRQAN